MLPITILQQSHQADLDQTGTVRRMVRIDFKVGDDGPFSVSIPVLDFTASVAQRRPPMFEDQGR